MRFSLKIVLSLTAYTALAAASLAKPSSALSLSLWAATLITLCYAAIVAATFRDRSRCIAIGFVAASIIFTAAMYARPARMPWHGHFISTMKPVELRRVEDYQRSYRTIRKPSGPNDPARTAYLKSMDEDYAQALRLEATNATGILVAGLIGCCVGALAYRNNRDSGKPERSHPN